MGIGLRIAPGVRISASSRGIRAGVGPRAARVHVGSGGVGLSTGAGPLTYYTGASGSRRRSSGTGSLAAYERQIREAERLDAIEEIASLERKLVSAHLETFSPAAPPEAPPPAPVDRRGLQKQAEKEALREVPRFRLAGRKAAKERAAAKAEEEFRAAENARREAWEQQQAELSTVWNKLQASDPETVIATVEQAFADNETPAAPIGCTGDQLAVVMVYPPPDFLPDKKPAVTPSGRPTLHKRNKTERNQLYAESLASAILVTIKEAFAVAPAINAVAVLVTRKDQGRDFKTWLSAIYCGAFARSDLDMLSWDEVHPLRELYRSSDVRFERKGTTAEVVPLKVSEGTELAPVLEHLASALDAEPNLAGKQIR